MAARYFTTNNKCEICGHPKGGHFNHDKCSKIKQKIHANDRRPQPHKLTADRKAYLAKKGE